MLSVKDQSRNLVTSFAIMLLKVLQNGIKILLFRSLGDKFKILSAYSYPLYILIKPEISENGPGE